CQTRPSDAVSDLSPAEGRGRTKERYLDPYLSLDFASGKSRGGQWRRVGELGKASEVLGDCPEYELILDSSGPRSRRRSSLRMRMTVARQDCRYGHRDATAILVAFRREVRASELVDLQWDQTDFVQKTIRINRVKNGTG